MKEHISPHSNRKYEHLNKVLIESYFAKQGIRKLHIGCGGNMHSGWLNSDIFPNSDNTLHLDATDTFPFENDMFLYVFSEHMIEHISYFNGLAMLKECYRILKNNGKIRISTPNLQFLNDLYSESKSELQIEYIQWATDKFIRNAPYYDDIFVINNFVRDWGHLFIYDEKTLCSSLERAGFSDIVRCDLNESSDGALRNLENETRMPEGFLALESFTLEAAKLTDN